MITHSNKKNHVTTLKSPSKVSLVRSRSTDQLKSTHKSINRKNNIQKNCSHDFSISKTLTTDIVKSKSVKSLKIKNKSLPKNSLDTKSTKHLDGKSNKKIKNKKKSNQNDSKTLKKIKNKVIVDMSEESFNSFQTVKKQPQTSQFFFYQNNYIPIQNSAQRRFVFKIKQIDRKNQQTNDTFFKRTQQSKQNFKQFKQNFKQTSDASFQVGKKVQLKDFSASTQKNIVVEFGINTIPRKETEVSIQTQSNKFQENVAKCFSKTLNDLEFLFLPDENNFQGFTKQQRVHYRQLFQSIAKKIWVNGHNLEQLTEQKVQILLYQRQCIQMGMIEYYPEEGFPTHIYAVMSYLTNLFSYAQINYKYQALEKIHSIYGYTFQQRFSLLLRGLPTKKKTSPIFPEQLFFALQKQLFKDHQFDNEAIQKSVHIHNKALFDAVNQQLQKFKPFYYSKGEPFPWSIDVGMTFFSIDQSTVGLLFKQIKQKILIKFGYLCGILIDYDQFKQTPNKQKHQVHIKKLQQQQQKMIQQEVIQANYTCQIQECKTQLRCDISTWILAQVLDQFVMELLDLNSNSHFQFL